MTPARRVWRWFWPAATIAGLTVWGFADVRRRGRVDPLRPERHMTDFTVYTEAGAAFFDGRPPYEVTNVRGWLYPYPPLFAMLVAPLHGLPPEDQVTVWFFFSVAVVWGCYRESARILRTLRERDAGVAARCAAWFPWLGLIAAAAALFPTLNCLQRGQVGILKLYLLLLGFRFVLRSRSFWRWSLGGIILAMPIVLKVTPALAVGFLLLMQLAAALTRPRAGGEGLTGRAAFRPLAGSALGVALGMALFLFAVPAALVGWRANLRHLGTFAERTLTSAGEMGAGRATGGNWRTVRNQSLDNALYRLGNWMAFAWDDGPDDRLVETADPPPVMPMDAWASRRAVLAARLVLLAGVLGAGLRLGAAGSALGQAAGLGLACAAILVVAPLSWGHYFMLLVPGVLFLPLWLDRHGPRRAAVALAVLPAALSLGHYALLFQAGRVGLLGLGTAGWLAAGVVLVARTGARRRLDSV